ncbi:MAG: LacI family transcriptional regulator [Rhodospirillaceae bacterium]|nr:MAG: LacI family transcriptional regulator [Rhodospirillaceae bacterium]
MPQKQPSKKSRSRPAPPKVNGSVSLESSGLVTSYDVATRAGVSQSAVSRCFMPGSSASKKMRERVMKAAGDLGYMPNAIARSLITRRSGMVAVIVSNLTNLYYPEVLSELTQRLSQRGTRVLLFTLQRESEIDEVLEQVWRYRVDGVIAAARLSRDQVQDFERHRVPFVFYNRYFHDYPVNAVCCDQDGGAKLLVDRLYAADHRRFAIIGGPPDSVVGIERVQGAQTRLTELGVSNTPVVAGDYGYERGAQALRDLLKCGRFDAIVSANDVTAIGAMDAARFEFGLKVPDEMSVVGFDGVGPASWSSYRLTTVRQPVRRMAEAAVSMLVDRIEQAGLPPEKRVFTGELIEGGSARLK